MLLKREGLLNHKVFEEKGIKCPKYDTELVLKKTLENPIWIHFGAGNIFRGYIARLQDDLLNLGQTDRGIIACETFDYEIIDHIYKPCDSLVLLATLGANAPVEYRIVSSIADGLKADNEFGEDMFRIQQYFCNPDLKIVSFTITEKGYSLVDINGDYLKIVEDDLEKGFLNLKHVMSKICYLLYQRFLAGSFPIALVSMDNCSHNGEKLEKAIFTIANKWFERGFVCQEFLSYLQNSSKVSFPWSMIDKITPRPSARIMKKIEELGIEEMQAITTSRNTYIASFVNAESSEYLVIEDNFPNGRPMLEKVGVYFTNRETVNKVETMKVTTCLNPLHTALAVFGCLLDIDTISKEMEVPVLSNLASFIGEEGMKVVVDPQIIDPIDFLKDVLENRLPNKAIPDTPQRIATDTSQKISVRYGQTMKAYAKSKSLELENLVYIPLAIAGWCRYLLGVNDYLIPYQVSSDPLLAQLQEILNGIEVGKPDSYHGQLQKILCNKEIFQMNLMENALGNKIEEMFKSMIQGKNAVIKTLEKYCK